MKKRELLALMTAVLVVNAYGIEDPVEREQEFAKVYKRLYNTGKMTKCDRLFCILELDRLGVKDIESW